MTRQREVISWKGWAAVGCLLAPLWLGQAAVAQTTHKKKPSAVRAGASTSKTGRSTAMASRGKKPSGVAARGAKGKLRAGAKVAAVAPTAESRRLTTAFTASAQLRPMAQQLIATRSPAAYAGVTTYAATHPGDAASTAQLALGHAYQLDHRFADAEQAFRMAGMGNAALSDYADYLGAQSAIANSRGGDALVLLDHFADRHPDSIFVAGAPVLLANAYLQQGNAQGALGVLARLSGPAADRNDARLASARAYQELGSNAQAADLYRAIYLRAPFSGEAATAKTQLAAMDVPLTAGERKQHADALFNAKHYAEAEAEYRAIQKNDTTLSQADRDALDIYAAVCDLRLKKLSKGDVEHLPVTNDDSAALKLYLDSELARNANNPDVHDGLVGQLVQRFPHSRWTEEALYSGGNMYLVKHDPDRAIADYTSLVRLFPTSTYAPSAHWHAAWLSYRQHRYSDAAKLMDEQVTSYPAGTEIPGALYWRGRIYEDQESNYGQALNYYAALNTNYTNTYYAVLGRERAAVLGQQGPRPQAAPAAALASVRQVTLPQLSATLPENDLHLIKARLLANAALNEYIGPEVQASPTSSAWGALAQAEIYQSFGENARAVQSMKHSNLPFLELPVTTVPPVYWQMLFPRPYWDELVKDSNTNGLDPYLVASLIRQESEFNPSAVSKANAYGLMQLLPSTGKGEAKKLGMKGFSVNSLLNPYTNLELGTLDLRRSLDRYGGTVEYALAAYNAGDTPVRNWIAQGDYKDVPEWVESIPYTETREYVQGIVRNREIYKAVYTSR